MALIMENNNSSYNYDDNMNSILLSLDSHKSVPAPFLTKTYHLVDDSSTDHIVSWGDDHSTFIVWRPPEFARDLLPNYFKHNNFSSFVRQLNTYGFRKIVPDRWEFANEYFKKGEKHLLCEIHRRKTSQSQVSINHHHNYSNQFGFDHQNHFPYPSWSNISPPGSDENFNINHSTTNLPSWGCDTDFTHPHLSTTSIVPGGGVALCEDNERLRRSNNMLMSELEHMRKLYNDIIYFVQNHVKPVAPSNVYHCSSPLVIMTSMNEINNDQENLHCGRRVGNFDELSNNTSQSSVTVLEEVDNDQDGDNRKMRLFGVPLRTWSSSGKKRLHSELGLNLMPSSPC